MLFLSSFLIGILLISVAFDLSTADCNCKGVLGEPGRDGDSGMTGEKGIRGEPGRNGFPGTPGSKGGNGLPGLKGLPGDIGVPGPPGAPGNKGSSGDNGPDGGQGLAGLPGLPGPKSSCSCPARAKRSADDFDQNQEPRSACTFVNVTVKGRPPPYDVHLKHLCVAYVPGCYTKDSAISYCESHLEGKLLSIELEQTTWDSLRGLVLKQVNLATSSDEENNSECSKFKIWTSVEKNCNHLYDSEHCMEIHGSAVVDIKNHTRLSDVDMNKRFYTEVEQSTLAPFACSFG